MTFLEKLKNQILIGDGAMGTLLYSFGTDSCFEELNLSHPEKIKISIKPILMPVRM